MCRSPFHGLNTGPKGIHTLLAAASQPWSRRRQRSCALPSDLHKTGTGSATAFRLLGRWELEVNLNVVAKLIDLGKCSRTTATTRLVKKHQFQMMGNWRRNGSDGCRGTRTRAASSCARWSHSTSTRNTSSRRTTRRSTCRRRTQGTHLYQDMAAKLVDTRGIAQPPPFSGDEAAWHDWRFKF